MNKYTFGGFLLMLFLAIGCNNDAQRRAKVIDQLRNSSDLATVEYVLTKTVTAKKNNWFTKDAFFFAETQAVVKAGIDLAKIKEDDIKIEGNKISLLLPAIKVVNLSYPAENFRVIEQYTDAPSLAKWNEITIEEKDALYRQAEDDIRRVITELDIVKTARKNTRTLFSKILQSAGFTEIYIHFDENTDISIKQGQ